MRRHRLFVSALGVAFCLSATSLCEEPEKVTVCQLQADPPAYNHKLVEVQAFVSHGFEDFTLFDPACYVYPEIWLEYGGKVNSGTIYFGPGTSARQRPENLVVQGIPIPLVEDDTFHRFDERIHVEGPRGHGPLTRAALIGTYFSGRKETYPNGSSDWSGFGHFGCCTLLAIQQVKEVSFGEGDGLDPYAIPQPLIPGSRLDNDLWHSLIPDDASKFMLESQRKADDGTRAWAFDDPARVALDLIESEPGGKGVEKSLLKEVGRREGFVEYELKMPAIGTRFSVAVSRPGWLAFYASDPKRVAWVALWAEAERLNKRKPMTVAK